MHQKCAAAEDRFFSFTFFAWGKAYFGLAV